MSDIEKKSDIFFIADTHFGDERILRYENRPFASVEEMDAQIVRNWNERVKDDDTVYLLGDVGNESFIKNLSGRKFLVKGNHDTQSNEHYRRVGFLEVYDMPVIFEGFWILSHEPLYVCKNMRTSSDTSTQIPFTKISASRAFARAWSGLATCRSASWRLSGKSRGNEGK